MTYIFVGPLSQMYLVLFYKFIIHEFIHFALPKCRLNLDQHEYKLLQLSSSASQCDTWVNMHSILPICICVNMHSILPICIFVIHEMSMLAYLRKSVQSENWKYYLVIFHLIVRNCCWGKRDQERPPKTKIFIIMEWWWFYFFDSQITKIRFWKE